MLVCFSNADFQICKIFDYYIDDVFLLLNMLCLDMVAYTTILRISLCLSVIDLKISILSQMNC